MPPAQPNIDNREIHYFEHHAEDWWQRKGSLKALHDINPLRLDYINARTRLDGREILDVGCGGGILSEALAKSGGRVIGIDLADSALSAARAHREVSGLSIEYRQATVESIAAESPGRFDVITCMELLEHVPDPRSILGACERLVKPNGSIFLSTINRTWLAKLMVIFVAEYVLRIVEKGTHHYRKFIRPREIGEWAGKTGLVIHDCTGFLYLPFLGRTYFTRFAPMNYMMHLKKPNSS
ncbi:MAG TPA: bifunctional 2-polyprenyl-6-hydroxyphenol methylase/3-demethylubiquinol 3-O-methyltransferase UbiG [Desulfosalsimonadaceae bacterium]|nr:bifunctional 2-polyprenyl-6-hydroxyphenol methylase/3-demethylubiquinol 3-O-methyltransferase UbiG [Desulfosalsimonadaceae bacterium]